MLKYIRYVSLSGAMIFTSRVVSIPGTQLWDVMGAVFCTVFYIEVSDFVNKTW